MQCKRCNQAIASPRAHAKGCSTAVTPTPSAQLDKIVDMLGGVMKNQEALNSRLAKVENAGFKPREEPSKEQVVKSLETNLDIVKSLHKEEKKDVEEVPVCHSGIHYPSDFGQKRVNGEGHGPLTPPLRKCFPATGALRQLVDEILSPEFQVDCLPDLYNSTFMLNIIVPPKYCVYEDYRSGRMKDVRAHVINNIAAEQETRIWCEKVKTKITKEHLSFQLPSPFTQPSMRHEPMAMAGGSYTVKQITL